MLRDPAGYRSGATLWSIRDREYVILIALSADEARALAEGLPEGDKAAGNLRDLAEECDEQNGRYEPA